MDDFAIEDNTLDSHVARQVEDGFHDDGDGGEDLEDTVRVPKRRRVEFEEDSEMGSNFGTHT